MTILDHGIYGAASTQTGGGEGVLVPVYRLFAGPLSYDGSDGTFTDYNGNLWNHMGPYAADGQTYFAGGGYTNYENPEDGTVDFYIYEGERYWNIGTGQRGTVTLPVDSGKFYTVIFHMAETYHWNGGSRIFNVYINGSMVLQNYDIAALYGRRYCATEKFTDISVGGTGEIVLEFENTGVDNPKVSGVEVFEQT